MNEPLRRLSVVMAMLFASLLLSTTWIQFLGAGSIAAGAGNTRAINAEFSRDRGPIVVGGNPVAESVEVDDEFEYQRQYPGGEVYAHSTGFYSIVFGTTGIEEAHNSVLAGTADSLFYDRIGEILTGSDPRGGSVELTIDPAAQQAAWDALGGQRGAIVALEPDTGRVLAMVSKPSFSPDSLAGHDRSTVQAAWAALNSDPGRPLENRALAGRLYPPGSVFKLVTAAAAIESGEYDASSVLPGPAELDLPLTSTTLPNISGQPCGEGGQTTLANAMRVSCNTPFGHLGLELGGDALVEQAGLFGYDEEFTVPLPVTPSTVPEGMNAPQSAQAAIGQFDVRAHPLQVAMTSAAIANDGLLMRPQLVEFLRAPDLTVIEDFEPRTWQQSVSPRTADQLTDMMVEVVKSGTGTAAQLPGVTVAGKSGTAQTGNDSAPHAWFTAFAPVEDPQVAVAVVVENGGDLGVDASGGRVAAPIAQAVMATVLAGQSGAAESQP